MSERLDDYDGTTLDVVVNLDYYKKLKCDACKYRGENEEPDHCDGEQIEKCIKSELDFGEVSCMLSDVPASPTEDALRKRVGELEAEIRNLAQEWQYAEIYARGRSDAAMKAIEAQESDEKCKPVGKCPKCGTDVYQSEVYIGNESGTMIHCNKCMRILQESEIVPSPTPPETEASDE